MHWSDTENRYWTGFCLKMLNEYHIQQIFTHWRDNDCLMTASGILEWSCVHILVYHITDDQHIPAAFVLCASFLCSTETSWKARQLCWRAEAPAWVWQDQTHMCLYSNKPTSHGSVGWLSETKHHYHLLALTWKFRRFQQRHVETHFPFFFAYTLYLVSNPPPLLRSPGGKKISQGQTELSPWGMIHIGV